MVVMQMQQIGDIVHRIQHKTFVNEKRDKQKLQCCPSQANGLSALSLWSTYLWAYQSP